MAPQSKVSLLTTGSCESLNDDVSSGPYSMLFIEPKLDDTFISNENGIGNILEQQNDATERESLNSRKEFSYPDRNKANETFIGNQNAFLDNTCTYEILDKQNSSNSSDEFNDTIIETRLDETFNAKQHLNFTLNVNETISQEAANIYSSQKGASSQLCEKRAYEDNATYNFGRRRAFDLKPLNDTTNVSKNYPTFDFEKSKKRSSKVFDISLDDVNTTIINSANSLSPSVEVKAFATNQTETPLIERNLNYLPINKSCESLLSGSSVEVKRRRTSNPKTQKVEAIILKNLPSSVDKPSSLPQLRNSFNASSPPRSAPALNKLTYSTPNRGEFTDALLRKLRISSVGSSGASDKNTNYDDDSSKRNSLEFEESLGILTPDQMIDGTIFTNVQSRSPSLEYDGNVNEFDSKTQENCSKSELPSPRDSSLGILDESVAMKNCLGLTLEVTTNKEVKETELQSPNLTSMTDCSLGILDAQVISNLTLKTDTTVNMELPLDSIDKSKDFKFTRLEQTPSPEELPLDPTPVVESDSKTEPSKSKTTNNSFITSITSITSLDTGYQGDGEMSRPASRGPDNSPLTRRPLPRPQPRRPDPMTDSDFYTESDADNHEDNQLRGDRRAQVIDGTLYGVDPQAAADIYVNNRENMDSSGIFTDLENNTRNEEDMPNEVPDVSPSDASTKTISENSQNNLQEVLEKKSSKQDNKDIDKTVQKENPKKRNAPSPVVSNPSNVSSPRRRAKEENAAKKYKMPKRDVASKVKAMLEPNLLQQNEKKSAKKPVGRWDAVMKKISTNEQTKTNLKEVKSKVFDNVNVKKMGVQRTNERKPNTRSPGNPKSPSSKTLTVISNALEGTTKSASRRNFLSPDSAVLNKKSPEYKNQLTPKEKHGVKQWMPKSKPRRIRNRTSASSTPKNIGSNVESSIHSSLSDLSAGTIPTKKIVGPAKKRDVVQVTQVLTANKLSPRNQQQQTALENKKNSSLHPSSSNESKASRTIFSSKDKKQAAAKECGRGTVKGGRTSPSVRPPTQARVPTKQVPRVAEALAVLVQHLVFNVEAYQVPRLKRQVEKFHIETDELRLACRELEEKLHGERIEQTRLLEEERKRCQNDIDDLIDKHRDQLTELNNRHDELEQYLRAEKEQAEQNLCKQHEDQLITLKKEFDKLQRTHEESLDILREENNAIREQIDEKQLEVEKAKHESMKLKKDYENKEILFKEHNHKLEQQVSQLKSDLEDRIKNLIEENKRLRDENDRLLSYGDDKEIGLQEVQSLRAVLELKQKEVGELRKALAETSQKAEVLVGAEEKARFLKAKCEDLQLQLQRKSEYEQGLLQENQKLKDSFKEESNQKKRLSQHNEELKWKLKQNKEVISKVLEQTGDTASFNRSLLSSSFNEKHSSSKLNLERTLSFRERTYSNKSNISVEDSIRSRKSKNSLEFDVEDLSPPTSPKVKGVVEKSDSVSYVLDLDESPDVVASRIVRRSFRNTTPPKNTPTKSPCNKRPRIRMSLSQSASSSAIITSNRNEFDRPKSASVRNGECDNDNVFIWTSSISSSPKNLCDKFDESCESSNSSMKLEDHLDLDEDHDVDIQLPALPSELDRQRARPLPSPKHLAGESMVSESNSEDESTSSSQL